MAVTTCFEIGDRVVHLGEVWYRDYAHRTGTVVDVNPCGTSYRGSRHNRWTSPVTKLRVRWDPLPDGRAEQTAVSWVMADWCRKAPETTPGGAFAVLDGEPVPLYDLPEARALIEVIDNNIDRELIPRNVIAAVDAFRAPPPPPVIDGLRADDV